MVNWATGAVRLWPSLAALIVSCHSACKAPLKRTEALFTSAISNASAASDIVSSPWALRSCFGLLTLAHEDIYTAPEYFGQGRGTFFAKAAFACFCLEMEHSLKVVAGAGQARIGLGYGELPGHRATGLGLFHKASGKISFFDIGQQIAEFAVS